MYHYNKKVGSSKLDITLLSISKHNSIRVKLSGGNGELGGDIFDAELFKEVLDTYKNEGGSIPIVSILTSWS